MPGVDGFEVLRRIRAVRAELPVVAVSARSDDESAYVERGFAAVLRKPFARAELVAVLRRVVPEAGVAPEECLPEEDAVRGFEALTAFARDDAEAAREIIRTFVAENEAHAETLRRAALAGDAVALRAIAHKMVPIYTLLGEEELAAALRRLERSEGSADGALRSAALGVAERVGEIVRAAKKSIFATVDLRRGRIPTEGRPFASCPDGKLQRIGRFGVGRCRRRSLAEEERCGKPLRAASVFLNEISVWKRY